MARARKYAPLAALLLVGVALSVVPCGTHSVRTAGTTAPSDPIATPSSPDAPALVVARIVDPSGAIQPGARVHVELERDASVRADAVADAEGLVRLSSLASGASLPEGRYLVRAEQDGFAAGAAVHRFPSESPPDVALRPASTVSGQVLGTDGLPVAGAEVRIVGSGLWPAVEGTTDGAGRFVLAAIPPGIYEVHVVHGDTSAPPRRGLSIEAGARAVLSFVLSGGEALAGTVLDDETGEPIAGAEVRVATETLSAMPRTTTTGADGTFRFAGLEARAHRLTITDDVHVPEVGIEASAGGVLRIRMARAASISGIVLDANRRPVGGAAIEVLGSGAHGMPITVGATASIAASSGVPGRLEVTDYVPPIPLVPGESVTTAALPGHAGSGRGAGRVVSEADGTFHVDGVPPGLVQVVARAPEYASASSEAFRLRSGEARDAIEIVLEASGALEGTVLDENDEVVVHTLVEIRSDTDPLTRIAVTDDEGHFAMTDVAGVLRVRANAPGRPPTEVRVEVASGGTRNVTLRLDPAGLALSGSVVDARGRAIEGAQVRVVPLRVEGGSTRTVFTDPSGAFVADRIPSPPLRVIVEHPDYATSGGVEIETLGELEVVLSGALTATGSVTDPWTGEGVADAEIMLVSDAVPPAVRNVTTDELGSYTVPRLGPGRWTRRVSAEGHALFEDHISVRANRWGEVELDAVELEPGVTFEGDVVDRLGHVVVGAEVMLDGDPERFVRSDEHGHFVLLAIGAGEHEVRVAHGSAGELTYAFETRADREPASWVAHLPGRDDEALIGRTAIRGVPLEVSDEGAVLWADRSLRVLGLLPGDRIVGVDGSAPSSVSAALAGTGTALLRVERDGERYWLLAPRRLWSR
jgi:hypothetical protein